MQGFYLSDVPDVLDNDPKTGVAKKIQAQVRTLCNAGLPCENVCVRKHPPTTWDKIRKRLAIFGDGLNWQVDDRIKNADYLYIRRPSVISGSFLSFLKKLKQRNPQCSVIMELPTYPYDQELNQNWYNLTVLWQDRFFRKKLHKYLDRIATLTDDDEVFGVPTLKIQNGVDLASYRLKKQNESDVLNIGCAAQFSFWHGIDRFLHGLAEYKQAPGEKRNVHLYLAGEGPQSSELQSIVAGLGLQDIVTFCGRLDRTQLYEQIYDQCDLGIESIGKFRHSQGSVFSTLKSREYLAVGLPFVGEGKVDMFEREGVDFYFSVPSDESPVDIAAVIAFYNKLIEKETKEQLSTRIRAYAERHIGWEQTFASVIGWLKQQCSEV